MRVLITGGTGFLGSHLCTRMVAVGYTVRILCRPTSSLTRLAGLPLQVVKGDITDAKSVRVAVAGCEYVIHSAANLNYWKGQEDWQMRVNVEGTRLIARAARDEGVKRLLHISSVAAVGITTDPRQAADENFPFNLENSGLTYHISKRRAEESVLAEVDRGLDAVVVNPASIQGLQRTRGLLRSVRRFPVVPCFSGGNCIVHAEDVVQGVLAALERGETGQRYILGGENLSFRALSEKAATAMALHRRFVTIPPTITKVASLLESVSRFRSRRPWMTHMIHYCANRFQYFDSTKARDCLGYAPRDVDSILQECLRSQLESSTQVSTTHAGSIQNRLNS
jgi:dihydroflavonol-4-reductase